MQKKAVKRIIKYTALVLLLVYFLPLPIKKAIKLDIPDSMVDIWSNTVDEVAELEASVGKNVTLLCMPLLDDDFTKKVDLFYVFAIRGENGIFEKLPHNALIYVHPSWFIGHTIKAYNWGFRNRFVFKGELQAIDRGPKYYATQYHIELSSWDIVYPVYHHELDLLSHTEFYRSYLFFFDYFRWRVN